MPHPLKGTVGVGSVPSWLDFTLLPLPVGEVARPWSNEEQKVLEKWERGVCCQNGMPPFKLACLLPLATGTGLA